MNDVQSTLYGFETREPDKRRSSPAYDIKQLWQRSHEIIGLALQGMKQSEIAKVLDISPCTVSTTLNSKLGREKLSDMRGERDEEFVKVNEEVSKLAEKALAVYEEIFDSETIPYSLKKASADTVLMDLGGHRAPTKIDSRTVHMTATVEEIEEFKRRGVAAARESGMLVELSEESELDQTPHGRQIAVVNSNSVSNSNSDGDEDDLKTAPE